MVAITTLTGREFNHDTARAKRAARAGPVFITDRGRPAHVLLSIEAYEQLAGRPLSAREALMQPGGPECDFDVVFERAADFGREIDFGSD